MGWIVWLAGVALTAAALCWGMRREHARIEREAAYQLWLETSPTLAKMAREFAEFSRQIGEALLPAVTQMADSLTKAMAQMNRRNEGDA